LTLLVLAVALPLLGLAAFAVWSAYESERERAEERLEGRARALAVLVDREISRAEALLRTVARSENLPRDNRDALLADMRTVGVEIGGGWVGAAAQTGAARPAIVWAEGTPPPGEAGEEVIRRALLTGRTAVSGLIHDARAETSQPVIVVAVPVTKVESGGQPDRVLAAVIPARAFVAVLTELELPQGWIASLVDASGVIAARTFRPESTIGMRATDPLLTALAAEPGQTGVAHAVPVFEGNVAVAAFARVPRTGYAAYILVPEEVFTGPLWAALTRTVTIGAIFAALGLAFALLVAGQIVRALQFLARPTLSAAVPSSGFCEVDEIAARLAQSAAEREGAEAALRASESRFRALFEASPAASYVTEPDSLRIVACNEAAAAMLGYERDELSRMTLTDIDAGQDEARIRTRSASIGSGNAHRFETRHRTRSGEFRDVLISTMPVELDGRRLFYSVVIDVTEQREAEEALAASERRYRFVTEALPQIVWTADPDGELDYLNERFTDVTGLPSEAGLGDVWAAVMHPEDLPRITNAWTRSVATGEPYRVEHRARAADGSWRWFRNSAVALKDVDDRVEMWVGTTIDFHEERSALEEVRRLNAVLERRVEERTAQLEHVNGQLADANGELEAFAYSVAHDLRAPLRGMTGFSKALLEDHGDQLDETARSYAVRITRSAAHLDDLINDLLAYSRLAREEIRPELVNLEGITSGVLRQLEPELGSALSRVTVERPLPVVRGHGAVLTQVLGNLIGNALKFVPSGTEPHVTVRAEDRGTVVRIVVEDNGIGIRPEHHERVFRVFERLHGRKTYPGTGIGLAIVKKGIERLGGKVGVESEPGGGSRFWFELPLVAKADA
jgi:PAS domain S-box-containing protein